MRLRRTFLQVLIGAAVSAVGSSEIFAQTSYTSNSATGAWNTSRWNNSTDGPAYSSTYTANQNVVFTAGNYSFAGMGASTNVGNITVQSGANVNFTAGSTFATGGNVRTIDVAAGSVFDFNGQALSTAAGTGFIKAGDGVLGTGGGNFTGGFTLNAGTVIARGTTGLGSGATQVLTLNGGTIASNATRTFDNTRFGGGIVIGGNVQFGELATVVSIASSSANLSFANNVSLESANRTLTVGNNGEQTFSGVVSNTGSGGITFAANTGADGQFRLTNAANTFTGNININGGEVRFTTNGSMGNAANDIIIDGGRFATASSATYTLGAGRDVFVGDAAGTSISTPGTGIFTINSAIANKTGETGSWAKQGGGTLELGGASTYTGNTAINNGIVRLTTGNDRLPTGTVVSLGQAASTNFGTLDLNGRNQTIAGLNSTTGTNATASNNTVTSTGAATLTIGGSGTYSYGAGTVANSGVITGAISLVKTGTGTQILGDANIYTGTTLVNGGTLEVNGSITTSAVTIATGGTLSGFGSVTGTVSVEGGGTLAGTGTYGATNIAATGILSPGNSPGNVTFTSLTMADDSVFDWELTANQTSNSGGPFFDTVTVTGIADIGDIKTNLSFAPGLFDDTAFWFTNPSWTVFTVGSGSSFGTFTVIPASSTSLGSFSWDGGTLKFTAVPEPTSLVFGLGLSVAGIVAYRRRKSKKVAAPAAAE